MVDIGGQSTSWNNFCLHLCCLRSSVEHAICRPVYMTVHSSAC